ncbi:AAA family ATPase [Corynebacterium appendicis]|uniref:AAA family ATPase n=1 Tax=Corynebacterium appendicis TaxID=163202 RepID=UPI00223BD444|nr:AAA family ATPase [Corynebacterium appendicis]MCT1683252.1 AAA family ATPase [Corynebacterium appendicis]
MMEGLQQVTARMNGVNAFERLRAAVEAEGLTWNETERGKRAVFQSPGHSSQDRGTAVLYNGQQVLLHSFNEDTADVLDALGLTWADLYDNNEVRYAYGDGRIVRRIPRADNPKAKFTQLGNTKGNALYGVDTLKTFPDSPVYIVEGEKDVDTARDAWNVAVVSQAMGASTPPGKADWKPVIGRDLIIVADNDEPGRKRASSVAVHLSELGQDPERMTLAVAAAGNDLSDHIVAGHDQAELVALDETPPARRITLIPASSVKTERLDWLIPNWIPKRSLTLLAGREGLGKSTIACDIAAQATRGELTGTPMRVAYLATEDSPSITVRPRLEAAGADLENVFFFEIATETGGTGTLTLPGDTGLLTNALVDNDVHLVVLDAAKSAMHGSLDGYRDDDVRQFLEPLAGMADKHDIAVLGLVHFGKRESSDPGKLILGSIAWSQIARSVLSVAANEDGTLVVTNTKGNLAPATVSREVRIISATVKVDQGGTAEVGRAEWGEETNISAADLLAPRDDANDERDEIEAVVIDYLIANGGSAPAGDVLKATRAAGLNDNAVKKARKKIGVKTAKGGMSTGWLWSIDTPKIPEDTRAFFRESSAPSAPSGESSTKVSDSSEDHDLPRWFEKYATEGPALDDLRAPILEALSEHTGLSLARVQASVPTKLLNKYEPGRHLEKALDDLIAAGAVRQDSRGNYYRNEAAA